MAKKVEVGPESRSVVAVSWQSQKLALAFGRSLYSLLSLGVICFLGCSAEGPIPNLSKRALQEPHATKVYPAHTMKVFITEDDLPPTVAYEVVSVIEVGQVWHDSQSKVLQALADKARSLGADAVIEVRTWRQPTEWSYAAPFASGVAVKLLDQAVLTQTTLNGRQY